ncbi:hypothetical protein B0I35DRAFT_445744 [Stachybotrys elegans]|uniref:Rhodopsin domain-containing protein n=1 Tax=Stachybotrys elegans TaxID=80388 RepID=A0A8K0SE64_9HYPO|nr:hypothetical protein B0I35DRAFT_445744 [Stachybotrys elegans]
MSSAVPSFDPNTTPLQRPPPGETVNFVDPPSMAWALRLSIYLTFPLMLMSIALRLFVRVRNKQVGWDDYILTAAAACAIAFNALQLTIALDDMNGRHAWHIPYSALSVYFYRTFLASSCIYSVTAAFAKLSLLSLYLRLFKPSRLARIAIWVGIAVTILFYTIVTITTIAYVHPRPGDGGWGSLKNNLRMMKPAPRLVATQGLGGTLTDFYVLLIPIYLVWGIQMPVRKKVGVCALFLTGLLSCACSIAGTVLRFQYLFSTMPDNRWNGMRFSALAVVELNIGQLCACIPVAFVLFKSLYLRIETSLSHLRNYILSTRGRGSTEAKAGSSTQVSSARELPSDIPRAVMTGIHSFIRAGGSHPKGSAKNKAEVSASDSYTELHSIDYEGYGRV